MKKKLLILIISILSFFSFSYIVNAKEVNVYVFHGETCPHCNEAIEYLNSIKDKYDLNIIKYEIWNNDENKEIMMDMADYLDFTVRGVPFVIIDNTPITGYSSKVTDETYKYHIKLASKESFVDKVGIKLGVVDEVLPKDENNLLEEPKMDFLVFKNVNLKDTSPFIVSLLLGLKDGFNVCSLWILLILIFAIMSLKDKRKVYILGSIYIVLFGIIYLCLMLSSLDFTKLINLTTALKVMISFSLVLIGALKINGFTNNLINVKDERTNKIKVYLKNKSFVFMILGTIILSIFSVLMGFTCDAGLSQIFVSIIKELGAISYIICILIYIISFILFSFIVYVVLLIIITKLWKIKGYDKYSKLISGLLLFIIGILLLVK